MDIKGKTGLNDLTDHNIKIIENYVEIFKKLFDKEVEHIFITNKLNEDNQNIYVNLWLISENYVSEVKNFLFLSDQNIDIINFDKVKYGCFTYSNYNFIEAEKKSTFYLDLKMSDELRLNFEATGENCNNLMNLYTNVLRKKI